MIPINSLLKKHVFLVKLLLVCIFTLSRVHAHSLDLPEDGRIILHESSSWRITRHYPSGYIDLFKKQHGSWVHLNLSDSWRENTYPLAALEDVTSIYLIVYDTANNVPSGRNLEVRNFLEVHKFDKETSEDAPKIIAAGLPGGIEERVFGRAQDGQLDLCWQNMCRTITPNQTILPWSNIGLENYEFIEVVFYPNSPKAVALMRYVHDDIQDGPLAPKHSTFFTVSMEPGTNFVTQIPEKAGIPYSLNLGKNEKPNLLYAQTQEDFLKLFLFDINRMPFEGLMEYGGNNLEGRIAWCSVYYLNGFLSTLKDDFYKNSPVRQSIYNRLIKELNFLVRLSNDPFPYYLSQRYSLNREPQLVALHLGRILRVMARAEQFGIQSSALQEAQQKIIKQILDLNETLEKKTINKENTFLAYRKHAPFWADGANVPYNYQSGIAEGLLENPKIEEEIIFAQKLLTTLVKEEFSGESYPKTWRYWYGIADEGWTEKENISSNTPAYKGNQRSLAHISYRSMDAMALIALYHKLPTSLPKDLISHFQKLTQKGDLLPFVNEQLIRIGMETQLDQHVARRFSRAVSPHEIQSQVWALKTLGEK